MPIIFSELHEYYDFMTDTLITGDKILHAHASHVYPPCSVFYKYYFKTVRYEVKIRSFELCLTLFNCLTKKMLHRENDNWVYDSTPVQMHRVNVQGCSCRDKTK